MRFSGDYHMHSVYSDGRATVEEMVRAASWRQLQEIGLTDHGPANAGVGVKDDRTFIMIKEQLRGLQADYPQMKLYAGAEADVLNEDGQIDLSSEVIQQLDYLLVGLHPYVWPKDWKGAGWIAENILTGLFPRRSRRVINKNSKALVEAIHTYDVCAVTHPGLKMEINIPEVARACVKRGTAWEINCGHQYPAVEDVREAARFGVEFIVSSDAHFPETVGDLAYGSWVLEKAGISRDRVRNAMPEKE